MARTIEIWFALLEDSGQTIAYLMAGSGERAHWVRNLKVDPNVRLRIGEREFEARARLVSDPAEDALARELLVRKCGGATDLSEWRRRALPVALELRDS